ncbi:CBS domain-containing protein [Roseicitreum antarcticum]|uniref:CBS domain-containing protein n=1 Tax=Roseicitreum antarcticum TaxID=564137 RepID=A0A1H3CDN3_9RHOB|nr:CBS domain-containing protein [Roseicitreum antarcticum]SDX51619.1 CBS domain-containing protein [Roseicitreum antarcticum]
MLVKQILKTKGTGAVATLPTKATLTDAVALLSERKIGAVVISDGGGAVAGILSERDIVRELGARGPECLSLRVDAVMTRNVFGCKPEDKADLVLQTMTAKRFRHLPVMEGDKMIGLISIGDVVAARLSELQLEKDALTGMIMGY